MFWFCCSINSTRYALSKWVVGIYIFWIALKYKPSMAVLGHRRKYTFRMERKEWVCLYLKFSFSLCYISLQFRLFNFWYIFKCFFLFDCVTVIGCLFANFDQRLTSIRSCLRLFAFFSFFILVRMECMCGYGWDGV